MRLLLVCALVALAAASGVNWALIVAGSNGYYNYRHQADVCHAFMMFKAHGFPEDHIISMMYDDIANNAQNPVKGNIINHVSGPNVYPGSAKIDYKGDTVTPANFLNILQGNADAMKGIGSGRVVASTANDNVFIFYSDHGAPGIVAFPAGGYLHAEDLIKAINNMHTAKKYHEMIFYIEACESGSMFDAILAANLNVYATTASNPTESSWACYWDASRNAYLGDTYSVNFLEDSDTVDHTKSTFQDQYGRIKALTTQSHVMQYGDISHMGLEVLQHFLDFGKFASSNVHRPHHHTEQVDQRDAYLSTLQHQLETAPATEVETLTKLISNELAARATSDRQMRALVQKVSGNAKLANSRPNTINDAHCLKYAIRAVESVCGTFSEYSLQHISKLVTLCNLGYTHEQIHDAASHICA